MSSAATDPTGSAPDLEGARRARALERLDVLGAVPPEAFRRLARLARFVAGGEATTVSAAVHLLDDRFQHGVAGSGPTMGRSPVQESLCIRTLALDRPVFTSDAAADPRLQHSPWTTGDDPLRLYVGIPLRLQDGETVGTLCLADIRPHTLSSTQRRLLLDVADEISSQLDLLALTRDLGHDASHDPLTAVANRVVLSQRLALALSRRGRPPGAPALLLLDLDDFKAVNDEHGHPVGDQVLVSTARRVRDLLRPEDLLARLGGDEFAVLVDDGLDDAGLAALLDRLAQAAAAPHDTTAGPVSCSFSAGVARARVVELPYELLARADADLYARKAPAPSPPIMES